MHKVKKYHPSMKSENRKRSQQVGNSLKHLLLLVHTVKWNTISTFKPAMQTMLFQIYLITNKSQIMKKICLQHTQVDRSSIIENCENRKKGLIRDNLVQTFSIENRNRFKASRTKQSIQAENISQDKKSYQLFRTRFKKSISSRN